MEAPRTTGPGAGPDAGPRGGERPGASALAEWVAAASVPVAEDPASPPATSPGGPSAPTASGGARDWMRAARRPRMVLLLLLVLVVGVVFVRLGAWQWERAGIRGQETAAAERAERLAAEPVPIEDVLAPQAAMTADELGRRVAVTGQFDADQQVVVPGREVGGVDAALVVTGLHVTEGPHAGAVLPVLRGWVPASELAATRLEAGGERPEGFAEVVAPDPPGGVVELVGLLNASEAASDASLPPGEVGAISAGQLTNVWGGPMYDGYLVLEDPPQEDLRAAPAPGGDVEPGVNLQSLFYAFEWWIFAAFAGFMWWRVLRDDVRADRGLVP